MSIISGLVDIISDAIDWIPDPLLRAGGLGGLLGKTATNGADLLAGSDAADRLPGGEGNDTLLGLDGNDTLDGGPDVLGPPQQPAPTPSFRDADLLLGGAGNDFMQGGWGNDILWGGPGVDFLDGGSGHDTLAGGEGNDFLSASTPYSYGFFQIYAQVDGDLLLGGAGDDILRGGALPDTLEGGIGNDVLAGLGGDDVLLGGAGDDRLAGTLGSNRLSGGPGADRFLFGFETGGPRFPGFIGIGHDSVMDFQQGEDRLDVAELYRGQGHDAARIFIGQAPFGGSGQPELRYRFEAGWTVVELDRPSFAVGPGLGGDGQVDGSIRLLGQIALTADDFIF